MRSWQQVPCIRYCPGAEPLVEFRYPDEVDIWVEYNTRHRPDCGLVVEDEIRHIGSWADSETLAQALTTNRPNMKRPTP